MNIMIFKCVHLYLNQGPPLSTQATVMYVLLKEKNLCAALPKLLVPSSVELSATDLKIYCGALVLTNRVRATFV